MLEILLAASIAKSDFDVDLQTARIGQGRAEAVFKVTNNTAVNYGMVFVKCVFFDADRKAVQISTSIVNNLRAKDSGFGKSTIVLSADEKPKTVACDVDQVTE